MKWFQHYSDSYTNLKIQELMADFGMDGYGLWWLCCELVAQQGVQYRIVNGRNWKKVLVKVSGFTIDKVDKILDGLARVGLVDKKSLKYTTLYIPKMAEYSDDYTNRVRRVYEHSSDNVRQDKSRVDKSRVDKSRVDKIRVDKIILPLSAEKDMYKLQPDDTDKIINYDTLEESSESKQEQKAQKGYDSKETNLLLAWGSKRLGRKFNKPLKQKKHIADMLAAGNKPEAIKSKWKELEEDDFWADKGIDFSIVASQIDKVKKQAGFTKIS